MTMTQAKDVGKGGNVFLYKPPGQDPVEMVVISSAGPLCVGRVYDHHKGEMVVGLYWIFLRAHGAHIGPFFAALTMADAAMKKILKQFGKSFFEQPLEWIRRQDAARVWIESNIGKLDDLIGGEWAKPEEEADPQ